MKRFVFATFTLVAMLAMTFGTAAAGNPFGDVTSTEDGYSTWDSDMIKIESVAQTGAGVYVAVLDTGLVPNWQDYFPKERIAVNLGTGFEQSVSFKAHKDQCGFGVEIGKLRQTTWVGSLGSTHGTHVTSTIIGYFYRSNSDAAAGFPLPPIMVRGIAPNVTIIPVKVLADYQVPALPKCTNPGPLPAQNAVFGTDAMVAAGIDYVTDLKLSGALGDSPVVINMSLGGGALEPIEQTAIDRAIENGVIIVAAAGNEGETGMHYPGAYSPVISAGSVGWVNEWLKPADGLPRYRMWWLQYPYSPLLAGSAEVADPANADDVYLSDFSSRAYAGQELDVLAPGSWVRGPFPDGYTHLPWYSKGIADLINGRGSNFFYAGGTSMATPHVASAAALILEKKPTLTQAQVESILKGNTLPIPSTGNPVVYDYDHFANIPWDTDCDGIPCDPVGAGLLQVDLAIAATP